MAGVQATSETALLFDCHRCGGMVVVVFTMEAWEGLGFGVDKGAAWRWEGR